MQERSGGNRGKFTRYGSIWPATAIGQCYPVGGHAIPPIDGRPLMLVISIMMCSYYLDAPHSGSIHATGFGIS
jgi:hypothetical protein